MSLRSLLLTCSLLGLLASCTAADSGRVSEGSGRISKPDTANASSRAMAAGWTLQTAGIAPGLAQQAPRNIASLPDRGELLAYRHDVPERKSRAYTWHAVDVSEAHALKAITDGELVLMAPDGRPLHLRYERHIEHPDGNWTWIGRPAGAAPGTEAIITFGEKAVFGTVPNGSGPDLRLTTGSGRVWMMETNPGAVAQLRAANPTVRDTLLPPKRRTSSAVPVSTRTAASLRAEAASVSAPTVDLLIGYTSGFATRLGGQSQANTRLKFLVDVTNQAYANSAVDAQVRLVKTMQVSYRDDTANSQALYDLTGCTETTCTDVAAALKPLHTARDQYGADLVSLVRNFNDPENESCGIAWLIGGGQTSIDSGDEYAGMSVVSDTNGLGSGSFPDNGYVCRDETLAHELGHNMGAAHDKETAKVDDGVLDADDYGRYPYSFGYNAPSGSGNFYTIMAYGGPGQTRYRIFSTPLKTSCGGHACGTSSADVARTLRDTVKVIASFRAQVVPTGRLPLRRLDANGDGKSDLLFFLHGEGRFVIWYMNGTSRTSYSSTPLGANLSFVDAGQLTGDRISELLFVNPVARTLHVAVRVGDGYEIVTLPYTYGAGAFPLALADIDGDGHSDIVFRGSSPGLVSVWFMTGLSRRESHAYSVPTDYEFVGCGDLNGDGRQDVVMTNASRRILLNTSTGTNFSTKVLPYTYSSTSHLLGVGDVSGDGKADLLFTADSGRRIVAWVMSGGVKVRSFAGGISTVYRVPGMGDFNGNGRGDLILFNPGNRQIKFFYSSGTSFSAATVSSVPKSGSDLMDIRY